MQRSSSLALTCLIALAIVFGAAFAAGEPDHSKRLFDLANTERAAKGVHKLTPDGELLAVAQRHSRQMAESGRLEHNPNLGSEVKGWKALGENVGKGTDADQVHRAFMNSGPHKSQILDSDYKSMAVGVVVSGDTIWVTQIFILRSEASPVLTKPAAKPRTPSVNRRSPTKASAVKEPVKPLVRRVVKHVDAPPHLEPLTLISTPRSQRNSNLPIASTGLIVVYTLALFAVAMRLRHSATAKPISYEYVFQRSGPIGHYTVHPQLQ